MATLSFQLRAGVTLDKVKALLAPHGHVTQIGLKTFSIAKEDLDEARKLAETPLYVVPVGSCIPVTIHLVLDETPIAVIRPRQEPSRGKAPHKRAKERDAEQAPAKRARTMPRVPGNSGVDGNSIATRGDNPQRKQAGRSNLFIQGLLGGGKKSTHSSPPRLPTIPAPLPPPVLVAAPSPPKNRFSPKPSVSLANPQPLAPDIVDERKKTRISKSKPSWNLAADGRAAESSNSPPSNGLHPSAPSMHISDHHSIFLEERRVLALFDVPEEANEISNQSKGKGRAEGVHGIQSNLQKDDKTQCSDRKTNPTSSLKRKTREGVDEPRRGPKKKKSVRFQEKATVRRQIIDSPLRDEGTFLSVKGAGAGVEEEWVIVGVSETNERPQKRIKLSPEMVEKVAAPSLVTSSMLDPSKVTNDSSSNLVFRSPSATPPPHHLSFQSNARGVSPERPNLATSGHPAGSSLYPTTPSTERDIFGRIPPLAQSSIPQPSAPVNVVERKNTRLPRSVGSRDLVADGRAAEGSNSPTWHGLHPSAPSLHLSDHHYNFLKERLLALSNVSEEVDELSLKSKGRGRGERVHAMQDGLQEDVKAHQSIIPEDSQPRCSDRKGKSSLKRKVPEEVEMEDDPSAAPKESVRVDRNTTSRRRVGRPSRRDEVESLSGAGTGIGAGVQQVLKLEEEDIAGVWETNKPPRKRSKFSAETFEKDPLPPLITSPLLNPPEKANDSDLKWVFRSPSSTPPPHLLAMSRVVLDARDVLSERLPTPEHPSKSSSPPTIPLTERDVFGRKDRIPRDTSLTHAHIVQPSFDLPIDSATTYDLGTNPTVRSSRSSPPNLLSTLRFDACDVLPERLPAPENPAQSSSSATALLTERDVFGRKDLIPRSPTRAQTMQHSFDAPRVLFHLPPPPYLTAAPRSMRLKRQDIDAKLSSFISPTRPHAAPTTSQMLGMPTGERRARSSKTEQRFPNPKKSTGKENVDKGKGRAID